MYSVLYVLLGSSNASAWISHLISMKFVTFFNYLQFYIISYMQVQLQVQLIARLGRLSVEQESVSPLNGYVILFLTVQMIVMRKIVRVSSPCCCDTESFPFVVIYSEE